MKIIVKAKPGAKHEGIEVVNEHNYVVKVLAPPVDGKANAAIVRILARHFDVSPSLVEVVSGHMAKTKVVEIHR